MKVVIAVEVEISDGSVLQVAANDVERALRNTYGGTITNPVILAAVKVGRTTDAADIAAQLVEHRND